MNGLLESAETKAARLGAVEVPEDFVKANAARLQIVTATPFEPTLDHDTIIYRDKESGQYFKHTRIRK